MAESGRDVVTLILAKDLPAVSSQMIICIGTWLEFSKECIVQILARVRLLRGFVSESDSAIVSSIRYQTNDVIADF